MAVNLNLNLAPDLPIAKLEDEITNAITNNQVIILSGETGSGKSTQLPKICAKIRDNINKNINNNQKNLIPKTMIAHTQPRRVAAVSLAQRISDEVNSDLGEYVGYQIRFNQQVSENTQIKLMTDGMLLTEIQTDRLLKKYHTIIIDEAHERSLNIDFLLGYIKNLLPKRPDLKIIITSATIEVDLFSKHFNNAPVLHVPGRTYPVDIIYKDLKQDSVIDSVLDAIDLLWKNNNKYKNIWRLTDIGKKMSRFPVDPRISRMILAAQKYHCIDEVLIIASFLSAQDPRIRPADKSQKADQLHREFRDDKSDYWQRFCEYIDDNLAENLGENLENNKIINKELLNYKYLVDEYRLSVFAQSLGVC